MRFLDLIEVTMDGFLIFMEMIDFTILKTFLNEFLHYLKTFFDVSVNNSAKLIHQFLKSLFNKNAKNINLKTLQSFHNNDLLLSNSYLIN